MGAGIVRGRAFDVSDRQTSERVVLINESFARRFFPGEDPIGKYLDTGFEANGRGERIVGVVTNVTEGESVVS